VSEIRISFPAREYQRPVINHFRAGGKKACCIWHRKAGKDRTATFIESELAIKRVGLYWHALPKYEDARKVIWDAITPDGKRLIDVNFPKAMIRKRLDHEMKLELINGSIWQPVGADNYDSLVGAFPVHVTWSEYALMNPQARNFIRPALAMSGGSELVITTARGYNHAHDLYQYAKDSEDWYCSLLTVDDTNVVPADVLAEERATMPDELYRQEYYCDWSAANVGAILGRYVEQAEREERISDDVAFDPKGAPLEISCDLGRRHASAFWFWQPRVDGFGLVDYDEDSGLDAEEWIERIKQRIGARPLRKIWLPHDARAKTFAAKHAAIEYFVQAFGAEKVEIVPRSNMKGHSVNAGQVVMRKCWFNKSACAQGLSALRSWAYKYDEERKQYSKEPVDDWSADGADAFCEGAKVMQQRVIAKPKPEIDWRNLRGITVGGPSVTLDELWKTAPKPTARI
jgi:phage terminase large subunit